MVNGHRLSHSLVHAIRCTFKQKLDAELYSIEHLGEVKDSLDERRKRHADKNTKGSTADASEGTRVIDIEDLVSSCKEIEVWH